VRRLVDAAALHRFMVSLSPAAERDMKIVVDLPQTYTNVTHLRVRTISSPSWVAWKGIQAFR
jgi:hypothetical protein